MDRSFFEHTGAATGPPDQALGLPVPERYSAEVGRARGETEAARDDQADEIAASPPIQISLGGLLRLLRSPASPDESPELTELRRALMRHPERFEIHHLPDTDQPET